MKTTLVTLIENVIDLHESTPQADRSPEQVEFLAVLRLCNELLSKCRILKEPIPEVSELADFAYSLCTLTGEVSIRRLFIETLEKGKERGVTAYSLVRTDNISAANIARYRNDRGSIRPETIEKAINRILKT